MLCQRGIEHLWHTPYEAMGDWGGSCVPAVVAYFGKAAKNVDPALVIPLLLEEPNALLRSPTCYTHCNNLQETSSPHSICK